MKLRTGIQDGCVHANGYCVDEDDVQFIQAEELVHDAATAHALLQALEWARDTYSQTQRIQDADDIEQRAAELMSEWGFDMEGE